jgi:hypothetical protein
VSGVPALHAAASSVEPGADGRISTPAVHPPDQPDAAPAGGNAPRETFLAMDALGREALPAPAWVHAGTQRAEAGFNDPALGWVGVRAETGSGSIHATLVPGSEDASAVLSSHLAGLNSYLAEHHGQVEPVTVGSADHGRPGAGVEHGAGGGTQADGRRGGEVPEGSSAGHAATTVSAREAGDRNPAGNAAALDSRSEAGSQTPAAGFRPRGVHISVMA